MTMWTPDLDPDQPKYRALADALARDIEDGVLEQGTRLPTHRELARELGVTVGTVTRGYGEAERRGLVSGEVGRGTFVRGPRPDRSERWHIGPGGPDDEDTAIDLSMSLAVALEDRVGVLLSHALRDLADDPEVGRLLRYTPDTAYPRHLAAGAAWLALRSVEAEPERIVATAGVQHALGVVLATLLRPGDVLLAGELSYPGIKGAASSLGVRIEGVAMDGEGIRPDALYRAAGTEADPVVLYVDPTLQNPTGAQMGNLRRREIAEVVQERGLLVLEDDVHGFLDLGGPAPLATLVPDRVFYLASPSKALSEGLRIGFVHPPREWIEALRAAVRASMWMPPPLMLEVFTRWLSSGTGERIMELKREANRERHEVAARVLADWPYRAHPAAYHLWLPLPEPWRSADFVAQARQRGVRLAGAEVFAVGRSPVPSAVRIALGPPESRARLAEGLQVVADLLRSGPSSALDVV